MKKKTCKNLQKLQKIQVARTVPVGVVDMLISGGPQLIDGYKTVDCCSGQHCCA